MDRAREKRRFLGRVRPEEAPGLPSPHLVWTTRGGEIVTSRPWFSAGGVKLHAHRWAWLLFRGRLRDGQNVRRACGHLGCVNPEHLSLALDRRPKGRKSGPQPLRSLTAKDAARIRKAASGLTIDELSTTFDLDSDTVGAVLDGSHIDDPRERIEAAVDRLWEENIEREFGGDSTP